MQRLIIAYSKIVGDGDLDFGKHHHSNINYLSFMNTGYEYNSDWRTNKDEMIRILKGIKNSSVSKSLKTINMYECGWTESEMKQILKSDEVALAHLQLVMKDDNPYEF